MGFAANSHLGGEVYDVRLLESMVALGVTFDVIVPAADASLAQRSEGIRVHPTTLRRSRYSNAVFLRDALGLYRSQRFDLFRVHTAVYVGGAGALFRLAHPTIPVVYHYHHLEPGRIELGLTALAARCATATVTDSEFSRRQVVDRTGADPDRVHVVYPGVDRPRQAASSGAPVAERRELAGHALIVTVGTLTPRKGVGRLVRLMPEVVARVPEAHLVVVGDGPERSALEEAVGRLGLSGSVSFTGRVTEDRKAEWLHSAAVYVSLSTMEGFGFGVAEAQLAGVPAVVNAAGSLPEVVQDGATGIVVDPADDRAVVAALCALLGDRELRKRMGARARERVAKDFTWDAAARAVHAVYSQAVGTVPAK